MHVLYQHFGLMVFFIFYILSLLLKGTFSFSNNNAKITADYIVSYLNICITIHNTNLSDYSCMLKEKRDALLRVGFTAWM